MTIALLHKIIGKMAKKIAHKLPLLLIVTAIGAIMIPAQAAPRKVIEPQSFDQTHNDFTELLKDILVSNGATARVSYKVLRKKAVLFNKYLKNMSKVRSSTFDTFSDSEKKAFYVNAYNAFTLKLIVDNYPVKSVKKIGGYPNPNKIRFARILGRDFSLENIEQEIRKKFSDPRLYLTLSCASVGCPPLKSEAYVGAVLDSQLDEQAKAFLRDGTQNQIDVTAKTIKLSNLFETYKVEFEKAGGVLKFASRYISDDPLVIQSLESAEFDISYSENNWDLNEAK